MPLPMLISYRGELREPVACQVEMAVHTKALLSQMNIPTYHFHKESDAAITSTRKAMRTNWTRS